VSSQNFFGSYAAIRFATGKKAPGILFPLLKAAGLLVFIAAALPVALVRTLSRLTISKAPPPPKPKRPPSFQDSVNDLRKVMK
jgi:hypothetical protein